MNRLLRIAVMPTLPGAWFAIAASLVVGDQSATNPA